MNSYIFTCTLTFETVIKAETQEQADAEFLRRDKQADVVHDSGITIQVIEDDTPPRPDVTIGGAV
jgi:hypothetical protein